MDGHCKKDVKTQGKPCCYRNFCFSVNTWFGTSRTLVFARTLNVSHEIIYFKTTFRDILKNKLKREVISLENGLPKLPLNYVFTFFKNYFVTSDSTEVWCLGIMHLYEMS